MNHRCAQAPRRLGDARFRDFRQRPLRDDLAAMRAGPRSEIDDVIGLAHGFLVVLDDHERVSLLFQGRERLEKSKIVPRMKADGRLIEHVKNTAQIRAN